MDTTKLFTILCAFLLLICLILSITSLIIIGHVLNETDAWQERAAVLVDTIDRRIAQFGNGNDLPASTETEPDVEADILYNRFTLKETNGKVGVYSEEGYLIRTFNIKVTTLPREARDALSKGITFNSWRELIALIEDYES